MTELSFNVPVITMIAGPAYKEFTDALGDTAENLTSAAWWHPAVQYTGCKGPWDSTKAFNAAFASKYNSVADYGEASAAASGVAIQLAVQAAGGTEPVKIRDALAVLQSMSGATTEKRMGRKEDVDPVLHLMATATGWGLNPPEAAVYDNVYPKANDGKTVHRLTAKDVPVDGFWSISVYNEKNFFEKNDLKSYSLNNLTAKPNPDGSFTIQFGGCTKTTPNCLVTPAKWSYQVRQYRPRKEILDGSWKFPEARPAS